MKYTVEWSEWMKSGNYRWSNMEVLCRGFTPVEAETEQQAKRLFKQWFGKTKVLRLTKV